jgi:hypothetical protein
MVFQILRSSKMSQTIAATVLSLHKAQGAANTTQDVANDRGHYCTRRKVRPTRQEQLSSKAV